MSAEDYNMDESREAYIARMAKAGFVPSFPHGNELQIDIDDEQQFANFEAGFVIFERQMIELFKFKPTPVITPSASGMPSRHIRIELPFNVTVEQRIAWQASLGSDPVRELLSMIRYLRGSSNPTLLMERVS